MHRTILGTLALTGWLALGVALWVTVPAVEAQPPAPSIDLVAPYRVEVGVAAVQLTSSGNVNGGVVVKCLCTGQTIFIGASSAVATATGYPLSDREALYLNVRNANQIWAIASGAAQNLAVFPVTSIGR